MNRQDRQGARTVSEFEQKYQFNKKFAEIMGVATDARNLALEVQKSYDGLSHEQIFNLLTNDGELEGLYKENGEVYINASYIKSGEINADLIKTGTINADLIKSGTINADLIKSGSINADLITSGTINADLIKSGIITSSNFAAAEDGTVLLGMAIDLDNGTIYSPKFTLNSLGEIAATGGMLGGFDITKDGLTKTSNKSGGAINTQDVVTVTPSLIEMKSLFLVEGAEPESFGTSLMAGALWVDRKHSHGEFIGTFAYYQENGQIYSIYIDPETLTVKAKLETQEIAEG